MLNELEQRILRYMIAQNVDDYIPIEFPDVALHYVLESVESLTEKGYVLNMSGIDSAAAMLTAKGKYYLESENKTMYGAYADKITQLEKYIDEAQLLLEKHDKKAILHFINKVLPVYENIIGQKQVQDIQIILALAKDSVTAEPYENELRALLEILKDILANIKIEASKQNGPLFQNINNNTFNPTINIEIKLSTVITEINRTGLSAEDKQTLISLISEMENSKPNKSTLWDKVKSAMKFLIEKGIEVSAIVLPFIAQCIR